jgi:hypothetical protein
LSGCIRTPGRLEFCGQVLTRTLTSGTGNVALNNGSVVSQGGLITMTATAGAITDADGGTTVSITNATGQATLTAATGIGSTGRSTRPCTLSATNTGGSGNINITESERRDRSGAEADERSEHGRTVTLTFTPATSG